MVNADLVKYFKDGKGQGIPVNELRDSLINSGWSIEEIDDAFAISQGGSGNSLVSIIGPRRIAIGFSIFILILIIVSIVAFSSEGVDVRLKESELLAGKRLDVGTDLIEFQFSEIKTATLRVLEIGVVSTTANVAGNKITFVQNESQTIDLDKDKKGDLVITLENITKGSPIFYFELVNKNK